MRMPETRRALYSSVLEDCKVSLDSCYLEGVHPADSRDEGDDHRMRAEAYLFFSILNLREKVPVISASQAIDSGFMLGYTRRCQNPITGANPFLEVFRRGYIRVFIDDGSESLREYLSGCLRRDIRVAPSAPASSRFIFSSISSVGSRSVPKEARFAGDTRTRRERELVALYGDMLSRVERGRRGLPGLIDYYYVAVCELGWSERSATLLREMCEMFERSLALYSTAAKKGYRLLPERAACAFVVSLGLRERIGVVLNEGRGASLRVAVVDDLEVYNEICSELLSGGEEMTTWALGLTDDQLRMMLHALETINQVECYFETVDMIDRSTRSSCVHARSAKGYLGPWCERRLREYRDGLARAGHARQARLTSSYLDAGVGELSRRSEMYNLLDRCAEECGGLSGLTVKEVDTWAGDTRILIDGAYKDVMFLGAFGDVEDIDALAIACANIDCTKEVVGAYRRLRSRCLKEARATLAGLIRAISRSEEEGLATSLCWEHFLLCKERMSAHAGRRREKGDDIGSGDAAEPAVDLARFRRMLPLRTFGRFLGLLVIYVIFSLADNAFFDPQGWVVSLMSQFGIVLPEMGSLVLQSTVFIVLLIVYELVADRTGALPSMSEVAGLWRSFLVERQIVALVQGVSNGVLGARDRIERFLAGEESDDEKDVASPTGGLSQDTFELIEFTRFVREWDSRNPGSTDDLAATLSRMRRVAREMGNVMLRANVAPDGIDEKGSGRNLVTQYDREIQASIKWLLSQGESVLFLAEEDASEVGCLGHGSTYVIDPIDGTSNFVFAVGHSCVSIARRDASGRVMAGVVYDPSKDECFWAVRGGGAYCNGRRLALSDEGPLLAGTLGCVGTSPYDEDCLTLFPRLAQIVLEECADIRRTGSSALDLCYVAAGRFSLYVEMNLSVWDVAAAALVVSEAGGEVVTMDKEPLLDVDGAGGFSVVSGTASRVERILERVRPVFSSGGGERLLGANRFVSLVEMRRQGEDGTSAVSTRLDVLPTMAGVVLAVHRLDGLLLLNHRRPAVGETLLEMPRGGTERGETSEEAAKRELLEETGLTPISMRRVGELLPDSGILSTRVDVFLVEVSPDEMVRVTDDDEGIVESRFVSMEKVRELVTSGKIVDGMTLAALSLLEGAL